MDESFAALHAAVFSRLNAAAPSVADIREAGCFCRSLPAPTPQTQPCFDHCVMASAFALESQGDLAFAVELYGKLMECDSADPCHLANAWYRYGLIQQSRGAYEESVRAFARAVGFETVPLIQRVARCQLATRLTHARRLPEALSHLDALLADPEIEGRTRLFCWLLRLLCRLRSGQFDLSREDVLANLPAPGESIDDASVGPWTDCALELELTNHPDLARQLYLRLLELRDVPGLVRTNCHYRLGLVYECLSNWEESARRYRMAVESPDSFPAAQANARFRLAELLYLSEEFEAALQQYAALQFAPELNAHQLSEAHLNRGICLMRLGRLEQARIALDACRESASHSAAGLDVKADLCLAECFEIQKDIPSARECYNRIIHNPSTEPATKAAALTCLRRL